MLALIDATGGPAFFELVRTALLGALEALPPSALLGLISFSDQVLISAVHAAEACGRRVTSLIVLKMGSSSWYALCCWTCWRRCRPAHCWALSASLIR